MPVRVGSAIFKDHVSIEIVPGKWTDTFIFPVFYNRGLPPWDYAEVVKTIIPTLVKMRRGASLWIPVTSPGHWYFEEMKYALRNAYIAVAVTKDQTPPTIMDFSKSPGIFDTPCPGGIPAPESPSIALSEREVQSLLAMARFSAAYTNEVASSCMMDDRVCRTALRALETRGYVEYHEHDANIDFHLSSMRQQSSRGEKRDKRVWPYWRIKRPGISAALRIWGVPSRTVFGNRSERNLLLNSIHRRRSRQWPKWVSTAYPHAEIYTGWNELGIPGLKANPDALAWGAIQEREVLFWLEVESGHSSKKLIADKTTGRWLKAMGYTEAVNVQLVFVLLAMPWVRDAARMAFLDIPSNYAVVVADWNRKNYGRLPFPKWGEIVFM